MQQPSSLIFLAIVFIWAAYLLQHWIRRREALATARSVDQFSDAMRVLERREHRVDGIVEQTVEAPHASRPSAPQARKSVPRPSLRAGTVMTGEPQPTVPGPSSHERTAADSPARESRIASAHRAATAWRGFAQAAATAGSPKLRAIALIASVSFLLITVVCAPFGALPWWSPILMLVVSGGSFYWCRISATAAAAGRRPATAARPAARASQEAARRAMPSSGRKTAVKLPKRKNDAVVPVTKATMPAPAAAVPASQPAAEHVFDVHAPAAGSTPAVQSVPAPVEAVAESDGGWQPVAVPPPTYTMKERAPERPQPAPVPTANATSYEHVPNEDLPFDGLALDQDLDDLPSVFRAG